MALVGSEGSAAALPPCDIRCSRVQRQALVTGSLIVLITAFLLIDVDNEFEAHRLHAPTEKGDAMFRAKGPSIMHGAAAPLSLFAKARRIGAACNPAALYGIVATRSSFI